MRTDRKIWLNRFAIFLTVLSLSFLGSGGLIYARPEARVTNPVETGIVDIELDDLAQIPEFVLPGMDIPGVKRITNEGNDCYIRARIRFRDAASDLEETIYGMPDGWEKCPDGFYYYRNVLKTGDAVDLFEGFTIPEDYPQDAQDTTFYLDVDVDAIQSRNFTPDFKAENPWGSVEIERCIHEDAYDITTFRVSDSQTFGVTYEGDARQLFARPDDFFANLPTLLPGDTYTDTALLTNDSGTPIRLYFWQEARSSALLDAMTLTCAVDGEVFYDGPLSGNFSRTILLEAHGTAALTYTVTLPPELQNAYTILNDEVQWIFSTEPVQDAYRAPKTGVKDAAGLLLILAGCAAGIGAILVRRRAEQPNAEYA